MNSYKSFILFISLFFTVLTVRAQKINIIESGIELQSRNPETTEFLHEGNRYIMYESLNMKAPLRVDLQVNSYDMDGEIKNSFMIDQEMEATEPNYFEGFFPVGNQLMLFKMGYDMQTKHSNLYAYVMSENGIKDEPKKVASIKAAGLLNAGSFQLITSPDRKKVLILSNLPHERKLNEKIEFTVLDAEMNVVEKKRIEIPFLSRKMKKNDAYISNSGVVFLFKRIYGKKKELDKNVILTFSPELTLLNNQEQKIGTNGVASTYKTMFTSTGNFVVGGMYYDFKKSGVNVEDPDGVFLTICNEKGELNSTFNVHHFMGSWQTNQLLSTSDGGYYLLTESVFLKKEDVASGTSSITNEHFTNQNAMVYKFNTESKLAWEYEVKRDEQRSVNDGAKANRVWGGVLSNDQLILVYRDAWARHDGIKRDVITYPVSAWTGYVFETLTTEGKLQKTILIKDQKIAGPSGSYLMIPQTGTVIGNSIYMTGFRNKSLVSLLINEL